MVTFSRARSGVLPVRTDCEAPACARWDKRSAAPSVAVEGEVRMSSAVTSSMTRSALASSSSLGRWSANNSTMICRSVFPTPAGRRSTGRPRTLPTACACRSRVAGACVTRVPSMSHRMRTSAKSLTRAR